MCAVVFFELFIIPSTPFPRINTKSGILINDADSVKSLVNNEFSPLKLIINTKRKINLDIVLALSFHFMRLCSSSGKEPPFPPPTRRKS